MGTLQEAVKVTLGDPSEWTAWPGGWETEISTALIDAVYSARAKYTTKYGRGIKPLVYRWTESTDAGDSISGLIAEIDGAGGPDAWKARMNDQLAPGRSHTAPSGPSKAAAISEAARNLREVSIESASDARDRIEATRQALLAVSGIGYATTNYFMMLLGYPGVKPDRMIHAFIKSAVGHKLSNAQADQELSKVADDIGVSRTSLDHAIWSWQRAQGNS